MRKWARRLGLAASCLSLSGCITLGAIDTRGTSLNQGIGAWQNQGILLNIVRASRGEPLYFLSLNQAVGSGTMDFKFGYPLFTLGPHLSLAQKQYTLGGGGTNALDNSTTTSFTLNAYSNQAFYQGIMQPLSLGEVNGLLNQGFPRELVFYLVIEKAKLTDKNGVSYFVYNDPASPQYNAFVAAIQAAMVHGLITEVPNPDLSSTPNAPGPLGAVDAASAAHDSVMAGGGGGGAGGGGGGSGSSGPVNAAAPGLTLSHAPPPEPQLCFEQALATDEAKKDFAELIAEGKPPTFCGAPHDRAHRQLTVRLGGQDLTVEVYTRSVAAIFRYLGTALTADANHKPILIDYGVPSETTPAGPLVDVNNDAGGITGVGCFAHIYYADQPWCVPEHGQRTMRDIFNVLTMLVALKQQPGDLPTGSTLLLGG